jgi:hypothetical protein
LQQSNHTSPPPQDEDIPAKKKPRLETVISIAEDVDAGIRVRLPVPVHALMTDTVTAASPSDVVAAKRPRLETTDEEATASPDDKVAVVPTAGVTGAASLPSTGALRAYIPRSAKMLWIQAEDADTDTDSDSEDAQTIDTVTSTSHDDTDIVTVTSPPLQSTEARRDSHRIWASEEDAKLSNAVKKHGNGWVSIAAIIPGRNIKECRLRWLNFVDPSNDQKMGKWTTEEDAKLISAVKKYDKHWVSVAALVPGRNNNRKMGKWTSVAALVPGRTDRQCRHRWGKYLDPDNIDTTAMGKWTAEEDAKLIEGVQKHGNSWVAVAVLVPGRNNTECRDRWVRHVDPDTNRKVGKWTSKEDAKLIEGVQKHGKDWLAVAALVPGRNNEDCHSRWNNHEDPSIDRTAGRTSNVTVSSPLQSTGAPRAPHRIRTSEEDAKLTDAEAKHGRDWVSVAALVPGRTNSQCRERWIHALHPGIDSAKGRWTAKEEAMLIDAVKKYDKDWVAVAALVPGRTNSQCLQKWVKCVGPGIDRLLGKWTAEEDAKLTDAVKKYDKDWVSVAALVPCRTNVQCRSRWTETLDPSIGRKMGKWTAKENAKLTIAVKKHGKDWISVSALVPGRTKALCRERWIHVLDPGVDRAMGKWTAKEEAMLIDAVKKYGKDWVAVATLVPGRTNNQCLQRWARCMGPGIDRAMGKWTAKEDAKLTIAVKKHGKDWVAVAALVPCRTNNQCRQRWAKYLEPRMDRTH